jgi:hypothetical protein
MAKPKFKNDSTKSKLGDQYQYLIALECCINAANDDVIYIEQRGDVATEDTSTEVKLHNSKNHKISDRHIDFWKTLNNLAENYEVISSYKKLVLLTTSSIQEKSKLVGWNAMTKEEKLKTITGIKEEKVTDTIKDFVELVFTYNTKYTEKTLLEILDKFCISHDQPVIEDKVKELIESQFFKLIPKKNRKPFLDNLMGYILAEGREKAENWEIKASEFNSFVQSQTKNYASEAIPIPDTYQDAKTEIEKFEDHNFVKEIKKIDFETQLQDAVNDYYRTQKTVINIKNNDLYNPKSFSHYQDNIIAQDLKLIKQKCELDVADRRNTEERIKQSKKTYLDAMMMPVKQIAGYSDNKDFFQRGTIHTIINSEENDFCWGIDE